ncbi:MAG: hypothetical protein P9L93_06885 [Candidatus Gorgyraea atricola]|nr:hypothetical protein [Candidatus Gorgyraea atricola]
MPHIKIKKIDVFILIFIALVSLMLRIPTKDTILGAYDQVYIFDEGARFFKTSFFETREWYNNKFVHLFVLSNQGISDTLLESLNLFFLKLFNLRIVWWSYFLFHYLFDVVNALLIYVLLRFFVDRRLSVIGSFLYVSMPIFFYHSSIFPLWLVYSVFFEILLFIAFYIFYLTKNKAYLYVSSAILCFILLGDTNFFVITALSMMLIALLKNRGMISKKDVLIFFIFPGIIMLANGFIAIFAFSKGYFLGLFGYAFGHYRQLGNVRHFDPGGYIKTLIGSEGLFAFFNLFTLFCWIKNKFFAINKRDLSLFENLFGIWNLLLLVLVFLSQRINVPLGLYYLPAIIFSVCYLRNLHKKRYVYIMLIFIITQFALSINAKYSFIDLPPVAELRYMNKDFGQKAAGFWIRENTAEDDSVLVVTPDIKGDFFKYSHPNYLESTELYFKKIYAYCNGRAPKRLFSVHHIFGEGEIYYDLGDPPEYIVDFSGSENNFLKLKGYINFPTERYEKKAVILNDREDVMISVYQKGLMFQQIQILKKSELNEIYDRKYAYFNDMVFSPYQGLWVYIP